MKILTREMFNEFNLSMLPKPQFTYPEQKQAQAVADEMLTSFVNTFVHAINAR